MYPFGSIVSFVGVEVLTKRKDGISSPMLFRLSEDTTLKSVDFEVNDRAGMSVSIKVIVTTDLWRGYGSFQVYQSALYPVPKGVAVKSVELIEVESSEENVVDYRPSFQLSNGDEIRDGGEVGY